MSTVPSDPVVGADERSIVVLVWERAFALLSFVSLFRLLRLVVPGTRSSSRFAEVWVMGHTLLAFVALVVSVAAPTSVAAGALVVYGMLRVFEIAVYQTNALLFDWYRARRAGKHYQVAGILRMVLLLVHNYVEIVFWFAAAYEVLGSRSIGIPERSILGALYGSFQTMVSLGPGAVTVGDSAGLMLVWAQSLVGLLMTILVLARFLSLLPPVTSSDSAEQPGAATGDKV